MSDLIDRKAAIDAFLTELTKRERKNFLHTWSTVEVKYFVADMLEKLPYAQPVEDIHREKEQAYYCGYEDGAKAARSAQLGWIPTSERTPEKSGMYLVTTPDGQVELRYYSTLYRWYGWVDMVAWMPLPKPWEGGQE